MAGGGIVFTGTARRVHARTGLLPARNALRIRGRTLLRAYRSLRRALGELEDPEFRITIGGAEEVTLVVHLERGRVRGFAVEKGLVCLLNPKLVAEAAFERVLEVAIHKDQIDFKGQSKLRLGVALWHGGLPVDVLPAEGFLDVNLGEENWAWPPES